MLKKIVRITGVVVSLSLMKYLGSYAVPLIMGRGDLADPLGTVFLTGLVALVVAFFYEMFLVKG